ncbi:hypothetical protein [Nocardia sp. NPDC004415]
MSKSRLTGAVLALALALGGCTTTASPPEPAEDPAAARITEIVRDGVGELDLSAAVYGVWRGGEQVALGESPLGVPATADMRVRVGQPMEPTTSPTPSS